MKDLDLVYTKEFFESLKARDSRNNLLCSTIIRILMPNRVIDVGCGTGSIVSWFNQHGVEAFGIEGSANVFGVDGVPKENIFIFDLRQRHEVLPNGDLVLCFNVAEHIDKEFTDVFIDNLSRMGRMILFAATSRNCFPHRLVNIRPLWEWARDFEKRGFRPDYEETQAIAYDLRSVAHKQAFNMILRNMILMVRDD